MQLHDAGDVAGALDGYRDVVRAGSAYSAAAYSNMGLLLFGQGRTTEAVTSSRAAAALMPSNADVLYNHANVLLEIGGPELDEAERLYRRALGVGEHAPSHHNLALLLGRASRRDEALSQYRAALACSPASLARIAGGASTVHSAMVTLTGTSQLSAYESRSTEAALLAGLRLSPADALAYSSLGMLYVERSGQLAEAAAAFEASVRLAPGEGAAYHNLGTIAQRLGQLERARAYYRQAIPLAPSEPSIAISIASLLTSAEAAPVLRRAARLHPQDAEIYTRLGRALVPKLLGSAARPKEVDLRAASSAQELAARLSPSRADVHAELGRLRLEAAQQLLDGASAAYTAAAALAPAGPAEQIGAALLYRAAGDEAAAQRTLGASLARTRQLLAASTVSEERDFSRVAERLIGDGVAVLDGALGGAMAAAVGGELVSLMPRMSHGRVGDAVTETTVRHMITTHDHPSRRHFVTP